ncbi:Uncharacterised protein [Shigella sonnei]|nr:hypothetical protein HmCms148_04864 [Escherichia coli]CSI73927.1 Uncharacterised protein [Shigella sonnei]CSN05307.1 Uncharacterised protein [Shigella sonnei]
MSLPVQNPFLAHDQTIQEQSDSAYPPVHFCPDDGRTPHGPHNPHRLTRHSSDHENAHCHLSADGLRERQCLHKVEFLPVHRESRSGRHSLFVACLCDDHDNPSHVTVIMQLCLPVPPVAPPTAGRTKDTTYPPQSVTTALPSHSPSA